MTEKKLKSGVTLRGDSCYCPLCLSIDSYGNCLEDCWHCYLRNLNHVWGEDLKPVDIELLDRKLGAGLNNKTPKTPLAHCLAQKKTIRWGNKTDPFQNIELKYKIAPHIFFLLNKYEWTFVIQTRFTHILRTYERHIMRSHKRGLITIMPVISPGLEKDWEILERGRTTPVFERLEDIRHWIKKGVPVGVNGEPFIPGYHTEKDFERTMIELKRFGVPSYNTYNFHFNPFVAKRLHAIGIDIEKIWFYNQDAEWKKILRNLMDLATKYGIKLGCPDFVNTGPDWIEPANTCCGVNVPNPCTFNTHHFKRLKQEGKSAEEIYNISNDGSGDPSTALTIINGGKCQFYTLKDTGL